MPKYIKLYKVQQDHRPPRKITQPLSIEIINKSSKIRCIYNIGNQHERLSHLKTT